MEDNDGSHGTLAATNIAARYKDILGIPWYANSPKSPDLMSRATGGSYVR
jgi:hypothetical protein